MRLIASLMTVVFAAAAAADDKTEWTKFSSKKGMYEASFPGKVEEKDTGAGLQTMMETLGGKGVYMTQVNLFSTPVDVTNKDKTAMRFKNAHDAVMTSLKNPKELSNKDGKFADKYPSQVIDLEVANLGIYRTKWILTPKGFYQIVVAGPKEFVDGKEAKAFWDSFKLGETD